MTGAADGPEIALIVQSVSNANARLRFFRIAFGAAPPGAVVAGSELQDILSAMSDGGRVRMTWHATGDPDRAEAKLVFLLLQCLEAALPRGGEIIVTRTDARWRLTADGPGMTPEPALAQIEGADGAADPTASTVQFALARDLLAEAGHVLATDLDGSGLTLSF